jgi:hypothetical protein
VSKNLDVVSIDRVYKSSRNNPVWRWCRATFEDENPANENPHAVGRYVGFLVSIVYEYEEKTQIARKFLLRLVHKNVSLL